jgi:hypothetical protein
MNNPCDFDAALAEHEDDTERADLIEDRARELAATRVEEMLANADGVNELLDTPGVDGDTHVARAMRNLDRACKGNSIALDAVLTAMTNLQSEMRAAAYRAVIDDCRIEAGEEPAVLRQL